ncbi:MAG: hypothetical protein M3O46_05950, partial [Myxococcota bacterium]|nr:hypothetical protein [Myxococcota bacterium]
IGCLSCADATVDTGPSSGSSSGALGPQTAMGVITASDCAGCTFPPASAMPCPATAPAIKLVYPNDNVLLPPNMNVISVQWTPFGPPYTRYSVDFNNMGNTDWHIITSCKNQTNDAQSGAPSGGCEVTVDPVSWSKLVGANRDQGPITVTVRGTTDGTCATPSMNQVHISFANQDLLGTYYYWQSLINTAAQGVGGNGCLTAGVGGYIWKQTFGDLNTGETNVTPCPQTINSGCNGCHSLSRDGSRMVVYSDDNDSDDEYSDVAGSYLDMTMNPATMFPGGVARGGNAGGGQPPGFSTIDPNVTKLTTPAAPGYYITSNGYPCAGGGSRCASSLATYPAPVANNAFTTWNGTTGAFIGSVPIGAATTRPTMPDWSPDGTTIVYVVPAGEFSSWRDDDAHIYGGSLYTVPYTGNGTFGAPSVLLQSNGENNYYPSYSPDVPMSYIIFDRVDSMGQKANCTAGFCADDSFSNPAARLMLLAAPRGAGSDAGAPTSTTPIDLEKANGTPIVAKLPWSNSYPRWAPFVQIYHGNRLLWFTFSSTRDYGVRVLNHKTGMYQCYPADAAETPGASHGQGFAPQCQEPQLWMAPLFFSEAQGNKDPSGPAFWLPYQKITTHNHTAQWTQEIVKTPPPPVDGGVCSCQAANYGPCGVANGGCGCCVGNGYCTGSNTCFTPPM